MRVLTTILITASSLLAFGIIAGQPVEIRPGSVNDIMVNVITPATNTIWGIENPQTDEEWQVFIDAASQVIDAATRIKKGGTGPNDSAWAQDLEWQRFADVLIESAGEIREAAGRRDLDAVIEISNDKMYPPCEECHIMFHPGMQEQEIN